VQCRIKPIAKCWRRGISAVEVVTATAVGVPMAAALFFLARAGSKAFVEMSSVVIGWPHM
jgi:hypothetical protein